MCNVNFEVAKQLAAVLMASGLDFLEPTEIYSSKDH